MCVCVQKLQLQNRRNLWITAPTRTTSTTPTTPTRLLTWTWRWPNIASPSPPLADTSRGPPPQWSHGGVIKNVFLLHTPRVLLLVFLGSGCLHFRRERTLELMLTGRKLLKTTGNNYNRSKVRFLQHWNNRCTTCRSNNTNIKESKRATKRRN